MKYNLSIVFFLSWNVILFGQTIESSLHQITGNWTGTLTYTDFGDDTSQTTLKCKMKSEWKRNKGTISIGFEEPNGTIYYDKSKIKLLSSGKRVRYDGVIYLIEEFKTQDNPKTWSLLLVTNGKDNRKNALIKLSIALSNDNLSLIKKVKYRNSKDFFTRNSYSFTRE